MTSKSGNDLSEEGHIKQGWRYYTQTLCKRDDNMTTIIIGDVRKALNELFNGKPAGSDRIPIELLKEVNEETIKVCGEIVYHNKLRM